MAAAAHNGFPQVVAYLLEIRLQEITTSKESVEIITKRFLHENNIMRLLQE